MKINTKDNLDENWPKSRILTAKGSRQTTGGHPQNSDQEKGIWQEDL